MCIFHLRVDHDGDAFPKRNRYKKMSVTKVLIVEYPKSEEDFAPSNSRNFYLEYESNSKIGHN